MTYFNLHLVSHLLVVRPSLFGRFELFGHCNCKVLVYKKARDSLHLIILAERFVTDLNTSSSTAHSSARATLGAVGRHDEHRKHRIRRRISVRCQSERVRVGPVAHVQQVPQGTPVSTCTTCTLSLYRCSCSLVRVRSCCHVCVVPCAVLLSLASCWACSARRHATRTARRCTTRTCSSSCIRVRVRAGPPWLPERLLALHRTLEHWTGQHFSSPLRSRSQLMSADCSLVIDAWLTLCVCSLCSVRALWSNQRSALRDRLGARALQRQRMSNLTLLLCLLLITDAHFPCSSVLCVLLVLVLHCPMRTVAVQSV